MSTSRPLRLDEIQSEVASWAKQNFPDAEPWEPLVGAVEELGELAHAHLKLHQNIRMDEDHGAAKIDALGDIVVYLLHYCHLADLSLEDCLEEAWREVSQRDWREGHDYKG